MPTANDNADMTKSSLPDQFSRDPWLSSPGTVVPPVPGTMASSWASSALLFAFFPLAMLPGGFTQCQWQWLPLNPRCFYTGYVYSGRQIACLWPILSHVCSYPQCVSVCMPRCNFTAGLDSTPCVCCLPAGLLFPDERRQRGASSMQGCLALSAHAHYINIINECWNEK